MLLARLDTGFNIEVEFAIAPFHKRLFAWFIDLFIQLVYIWIVDSMLDSLIGGFRGDEYAWIGVLVALPLLCYHLLMEVFFNGQSIGKKLLSIKVITAEGGTPTLGQYLIRWLFRIIDFAYWIPLAIYSGVLPWWILPFITPGFICILATPKSQRIGDLVAGTIMIDLRTRTSWQDTVFTEIESTYQPKYPAVMQLTDRDINTLKSIIQSVKRKNDYDLSMRIADRIKSKLKMESDQNSLDFLETLLKDYNYYSTNN